MDGSLIRGDKDISKSFHDHGKGTGLKKKLIFWIGLFVVLLLNHVSCSYSLEIRSLLVASFAKIFSHSIGCFFIFLMVSFAVQKILSLIRSHWFIL